MSANENDNGSVEAEPKQVSEYTSALVKEKYSLDAESHPVTMKLIDDELSKVQLSNSKVESPYLDINSDKAIRLSAKIMVPVKEFPRFNFVGKLLGPKGNSLKRLQEDTMTKMAILGKGSMRNKEKEEEMKSSLNPKFAHLTDELHVQVTAYASPAEAYARLAYALAELRKFLVPDHNDQIAQEQAREMSQFGGAPPVRHPGAIIHAPPPPSVIRQMPPQARMARGAPPVAGKAKVLSILDRARSSLEGPNAYSPNGGYGDSGSSHYSHFESGYGGVATYNGGGNDDYYSGNSYSQDNSQGGGGRGWKNYNTSGGGLSKLAGNQGGRYGGRNAPYARQK